MHRSSCMSEQLQKPSYQTGFGDATVTEGPLYTVFFFSFCLKSSYSLYSFADVKQFITGRRYEVMTLHSVMQGMSTSECDWLLPPRKPGQQYYHNLVESLKRRELLEEFIFWYFDQFVLPLLKVSAFINSYLIWVHSNYLLRQRSTLPNRLRSGIEFCIFGTTIGIFFVGLYLTDWLPQPSNV